MSIFDRSGLVRLSDLETTEWRENFELLRTWHDEFARQGPNFRSTYYIWPTEPLYCWSRVWEYPYAYFQLKRFASSFPGVPKIADVGSGVTFFPFAIADLGADVVCTDIDRTCELDLARASGIISHRGSVSFRLGAEHTLPYADAELDAVYCISVLEHIPNFEQTIAYPMISRDTAWFRLKQVVKPLLGRTPISAPLLAVESAVLVKTSNSGTAETI